MMPPANAPTGDFISSCVVEETVMSPTRISVLALIAATLAGSPATATAPPSAAATVAGDGTLVRGIAVTSASHVDTGVYVVTFADPNVPSACAFTASVGGAAGENVAASLINVGGGAAPGSLTGDVIVHTYSATTRAPADLPFNIYVAC
jgi:hypothetical protein